MNYDTQETTITTDQQHELQALVDKYAGGDLRHATKELAGEGGHELWASR